MSWFFPFIGIRILLIRPHHERAAIVYYLVDSCKALDVNPREWMEDVLLRIPGSENNREALRELLPNRWLKQSQIISTRPKLPRLG